MVTDWQLKLRKISTRFEHGGSRSCSQAELEEDLNYEADKYGFLIAANALRTGTCFNLMAHIHSGRAIWLNKPGRRTASFQYLV